MKNIVRVDTSDAIRKREQIENLEREKAFWMKTAESLLDDLEKIFDAAETDGKVRIIQRTRVIDLIVAPKDEPKCPPTDTGSVT